MRNCFYFLDRSGSGFVKSNAQTSFTATLKLDNLNRWVPVHRKCKESGEFLPKSSCQWVTLRSFAVSQLMQNDSCFRNALPRKRQSHAQFDLVKFCYWDNSQILSVPTFSQGWSFFLDDDKLQICCSCWHYKLYIPSKSKNEKLYRRLRVNFNQGTILFWLM